MRFTWLEEKNEANIKKHGIAFGDAVAVFDGPTVEWEDDRNNYGESRRLAIGFMTDTLVVAVVYVDEDAEDDTYTSSQPERRKTMSASDSKRSSGTGRTPKVSKHGTDFARLQAMTDDDIKQQIADDPDAAPLLTEEWWAKGELVMPGKKRPISIRFDLEVLDYFMAGGQGYQSRMNEVLLRYVRMQRQREILAAMVKTEPGKGRPDENEGGKTIDLADALRTSLERRTKSPESTAAVRVASKHRGPDQAKKSAR
jgi:uncharacterized DUF497 family protein